MQYDFIHMWHIRNKQTQNKKQKNEQTKPNKSKHIDTEKRVVVTRGEGVGWG